jgi:hypothetical protein
MFKPQQPTPGNDPVEFQEPESDFMVQPMLRFNNPNSGPTRAGYRPGDEEWPALDTRPMLDIANGIPVAGSPPAFAWKPPEVPAMPDPAIEPTRPALGALFKGQGGNPAPVAGPVTIRKTPATEAVKPGPERPGVTPPSETPKPAPRPHPVPTAKEQEPRPPAPTTAVARETSPAIDTDRPKGPVQPEPPKEKDDRDTAARRLNAAFDMVKRKDVSPERYHKAMAVIKKARLDGQIKDIRIPAARLAAYEQAHPREAADFLNATGAVEHYDEALEKDGDIVIPYDAFIHHAADLPARDDLVRDLRFASGQRTSREAESEREDRTARWTGIGTGIEGGRVERDGSEEQGAVFRKTFGDLPDVSGETVRLPTERVAALSKLFPEEMETFLKATGLDKRDGETRDDNGDLVIPAEDFIRHAINMPHWRRLAPVDQSMSKAQHSVNSVIRERIEGARDVARMGAVSREFAAYRAVRERKTALNAFNMIDQGLSLDDVKGAVPHDDRRIFQGWGNAYRIAHEAGNMEVKQKIRVQVESQYKEAMDTATREAIDAMPEKKVAEWLSSVAEKHFPIRDDLANDFWWTTLPKGAASLAPFLMGGLVSGGGTMVGRAATSLGVLTSGTKSFHETLKQGKSIEDAYKSFWKSAGIKATDFVPVLKLLDNADKNSGGAVKLSLIQVLKDSGKEASKAATKEFAKVVGEYLSQDEIATGLEDLSTADRAVGKSASAGVMKFFQNFLVQSMAAGAQRK